MAHKLILKIEPSSGEPELDAVKAFSEILAAIDLANETLPPEARCMIKWELERASKNSPFTVEMDPYSSPQEDIGFRAVHNFTDTLSFLMGKGGEKPDYLSKKALGKAKKLFAPNTDDIRTDISVPELDKRFHITSAVAHQALSRIEELLGEEPAWPVELGSVEGIIKDVRRYKNRPSFTLVDRRDGKTITCIIKDDAREDQIGQEHTWKEAWEEKRFIVRGKIIRDADGNIERIEVADVSRPPAPPDDITKLFDENFTEGLPAEEYLRKIRGDEK